MRARKLGTGLFRLLVPNLSCVDEDTDRAVVGMPLSAWGTGTWLIIANWTKVAALSALLSSSTVKMTTLRSLSTGNTLTDSPSSFGPVRVA
jgi:hypothetical protein